MQNIKKKRVSKCTFSRIKRSISQSLGAVGWFFDEVFFVDQSVLSVVVIEQ